MVNCIMENFEEYIDASGNVSINKTTTPKRIIKNLIKHCKLNKIKLTVITDKYYKNLQYTLSSIFNFKDNVKESKITLHQTILGYKTSRVVMYRKEKCNVIDNITINFDSNIFTLNMISDKKYLVSYGINTKIVKNSNNIRILNNYKRILNNLVSRDFCIKLYNKIK